MFMKLQVKVSAFDKKVVEMSSPCRHDMSVGTNGLMLYTVLCAVALEEGSLVVHPTRSYLKELGRMCDRTLKSATQELVDKGWIDFESGMLDGKHNTYVLKGVGGDVENQFRS
jgi:hypothetical protein